MTKHYTYILSGQSYGPIFIGAAQDIVARVSCHKRGHLSVDAFRIDRLVFVEEHGSERAAEARAKALKSASREWIDALVEKSNPDWRDMAAATQKRDLKAA